MFSIALLALLAPKAADPVVATSQASVTIRVSVRPMIRVAREADGNHSAKATNMPIKLTTRREGDVIIVVPE